MAVGYNAGVRSPACRLAIAILVLMSCDRPEGGAETRSTPQPSVAPTVGAASPTAVAPTPSGAPPTPTPTTTDAATPTSPAPVTPAPIADPATRFAQQISELTAGEPTGDPEAAAWVEYRAGRFSAAEPGFARASLAEPSAWKHPFNLACAAARAEHHDLARIALREAVRRGGARVVAKARKDADLATVRSAAWFESVMRGEDEPASGGVAPAATPAPAPSVPTPTPSPTSVTPPSVPAPPRPATLPGWSAAVTTALTKPEIAALELSIETSRGVKPAVRKTLVMPTADGGRRAYAVIELSRWKLCLQGADKKRCRAELGPAREGERNDALCTEQQLVELTPGTPILLGKSHALDVGCKIAKVRVLAAVDLDSDGAQEIVLDATSRHSYDGFREGDVTEFGRIVRVLHLDGSVQLNWSDEAYMTQSPPSIDDAWRIYFADANADGHADAVLQHRISSPELELDDELWPEEMDPAENDRDITGHPEQGPIITQVFHYDPATDAWQGAAEVITR